MLVSAKIGPDTPEWIESGRKVAVELCPKRAGATVSREEFARSVKTLCDSWISNESPRIFPKIAARAATEGPKGCFLMAVNGVPVGWTDPHGASLDWISELPESEG